MEESKNFIEEIIEKDVNNGLKEVVTRFPPEPNGYLHIGHAKAICLNFGLTKEFKGYTNLRFDDTNPSTEETEYVESIKEDIKWLGFEWKNELYASDYFDQLYEFAIKLINKNLAYVDDSTPDEIARLKGTPTQAGIDSPNRDRPIEENLDLFKRMAAGEFDEGSMVLRAKIDMSSPNMLMRDPNLYRIKKTAHHRTGTKWNIYPLYDFAHGQSDSIEHITHSICTLEFVPHREVYDWLINKLEIFPSKQYEFARLNLTYTVMSKRKLLQLVNENYVNGWDDPRMPTLSGMRRKGYPPEAIVAFCDRIGVAKRENLIDLSLLEFFVRERLNKVSDRVMAVLNPLKVTITNLPEGEKIISKVINNPEDENSLERDIPFTREIYIEKDDFMENPPKKYFRLQPEGYVRLKGAFIIQCKEVIKDEKGEVIELKCVYVENSKSGEDTSGLKVKGTIQWVSISEAVKAELRIYDRLFLEENVGSIKDDFKQYINPNSLITVSAYLESSLKNANFKTYYQFMRNGYFVLDKDSSEQKLIFNKTVSLKDSFSIN